MFTKTSYKDGTSILLIFGEPINTIISFGIHLHFFWMVQHSRTKLCPHSMKINCRFLIRSASALKTRHIFTVEFRRANNWLYPGIMSTSSLPPKKMVSSNTVFCKFEVQAPALLSIGEGILATLRVEINFSKRFIEL